MPEQYFAGAAIAVAPGVSNSNASGQQQLLQDEKLTHKAAHARRTRCQGLAVFWSAAESPNALCMPQFPQLHTPVLGNSPLLAPQPASGFQL